MAKIEALLKTELGPMVAVADDQGVHLLRFADGERVVQERRSNQITMQLQRELDAYFAGTLRAFQTPIHLAGTPFQRAVWCALQKVPYGEQRSYREQAEGLGKPTAYRAVANANGANQIVLLIPCHRIVRSDGDQGGYGGGSERKKWLLHHEQAHR